MGPSGKVPSALRDGLNFARSLTATLERFVSLEFARICALSHTCFSSARKSSKVAKNTDLSIYPGSEANLRTRSGRHIPESARSFTCDLGQPRSLGRGHVPDVPIELPETLQPHGFRMSIKEGDIHSPWHGLVRGPRTRRVSGPTAVARNTCPCHTIDLAIDWPAKEEICWRMIGG